VVDLVEASTRNVIRGPTTTRLYPQKRRVRLIVGIPILNTLYLRSECRPVYGFLMILCANNCFFIVNFL